MMKISDTPTVTKYPLIIKMDKKESLMLLTDLQSVSNGISFAGKSIIHALEDLTSN